MSWGIPRKRLVLGMVEGTCCIGAEEKLLTDKIKAQPRELLKAPVNRVIVC